FFRLREWQDVHAQLRQLVHELAGQGKRHSRLHNPRVQVDELPPPLHATIHRSLLSGLLGNIGAKGEMHEYTGARGTKFSVFPGSSLFKQKPPWLMAAEIVETTKLYARTIGPIRPEWVEQLAQHLVR